MNSLTRSGSMINFPTQKLIKTLTIKLKLLYRAWCVDRFYHRLVLKKHDLEIDIEIILPLK